MAPGERLRQLDVLRAAAIFLVLLQHSEGPAWTRVIGWSGVDLFFVLSGFLVSGLLFSEDARSGSVNAVRFLVRRGFKIYPAFWAMIAATLVLCVALGIPIDWNRVQVELMFLQNYGPSLWGHTWSLAIEEHFYFALAATWRLKPALFRAAAGVRWMVVTLAVILVTRSLLVALLPAQLDRLTAWGTPARLDSLVFGVLLAYLHHHHLDALRGFVWKHRAVLLAGSALCLAPLLACSAEACEKTAFTRSVGYTLLYLSYGTLMIVLLHSAPMPGPAGRILAAIGRYSYGIYLWHLPLGTLIRSDWVRARVPVESVTGSVALYVVSCVIGGMVLARLIETPFLRLRDRLAPSTVGSAVTSPGTAPPAAAPPAT